MNSRSPALLVLPGLVLANLFVLLLTAAQTISLGAPYMVIDWGLLPERFSEALLSGNLKDIAYNVLTIFSSMFLHGGFDHFLNNMVLLVIVGIVVEREFGALRFLAIYLLGGTIGALGHYVVHAFSPLPMIGASGAIAGLMGAFLIAVFCLDKRITLLRVIGVVFVGQWFVEQLVSAYLESGARHGIAYGAHITGFLGGLMVAYFIAKSMKRNARKISPQLANDRSNRFLLEVDPDKDQLPKVCDSEGSESDEPDLETDRLAPDTEKLGPYLNERDPNPEKRDPNPDDSLKS